MPKNTILFDLDMTLVNTSKLKAARDSQQWGEVEQRLGEVEEFRVGNYYAHRMPGMVKMQGWNVGIVTASPSWYAQDIIQRFGIAYDVLVTGSDGCEPKPSPAPLQMAMTKLKNPGGEVYYMGDDIKDMQAAFNAGYHPVGARWGMDLNSDMAGHAPDYLIYTPRILEDLSKLQCFGYIMEVAATGATKEINLFQGSFIYEMQAGLPFYSLGRYYAQSDKRAIHSPLSSKILKLKDGDDDISSFSYGFANFIKLLAWLKISPDMITCVPPWAGKDNRFAPILSDLPRIMKDHRVVIPGLQIHTNGLGTAKRVEDFKHMGAAARSVAIHGAFTTPVKWHGRVLLLDDVLTSGATMSECARVLKNNGAAEVMCIALAKTQDQRFMEKKICPKCKRPMAVRTNRVKGNRFWGCTGYPMHCQYTENMTV